MRILVTGAFGNIGKLLINELIKQNYSVRCLVLPSIKNKKISQKIRQRIKPEVSPEIRVLETEGKK